MMNIIKQILKSKTAQLGWIEFKYFIVGTLLGLVLMAILAYLANHGILPFKLSFLCAPVK